MPRHNAKLINLIVPVMANQKVKLINKGSYVSLCMDADPRHSESPVLFSLGIMHLNSYVCVGYTGQWFGEANNIKTSRVFNWHTVWRNGQSFRSQIK